jgi:hypothetical protein
MAKQKGIIKLQGTIGDITFVKTKDGYIAKEKTQMSASRMATDSAFQRTRENASEFGRAGKAGKVLRQSIRPLLQNAKDSRVTSRLTKLMMKVIKADATSTRGMRNVVDGEAQLLQGFEFNVDATISAALYTQFVATINRVTGQLEVNMPAFIPKNDMVIPDGATHYKIVSAAAEIDFEAGTFVTQSSDSTILPWDANLTQALTLTNNVTPNSTHPLFLVVGIQFFQQVNNVNYSLKNGAFNALSLVKVSGV